MGGPNLNHSKWMRLAIRKGLVGVLKGQTPFGACIVKDGQLISAAHNQVWMNTDIIAHAEMQAIREACRKLHAINLCGCIIYSTCEPCPMCFSACHWARISQIYYGTSIRDAKAIGFNELSLSNTRMKRWGKSSVRINGGLLKGECLRLFRIWMNRSGRRVY